jgi:tetratricopeptide (TPR) repeat protein
MFRLYYFSSQQVLFIIAAIILEQLVRKRTGNPKGLISTGEKLSKEIGSEDKSYYYALVDEYLNSGQTGRALLQSTKNIAYHEDDPVAYINRARVYEKQGSLDNAILDLKEALRISPDNKEVLTYLEKIYLGIGKK